MQEFQTQISLYGPVEQIFDWQIGDGRWLGRRHSRHRTSCFYCHKRYYRDPVQAIARGESVRLAKEISRQSSVMVRGLLKESDAKDFRFEISIQDISVRSRASYPLPHRRYGKDQFVY